MTEVSSSPVTFSPSPKEGVAASSTPVEAGTVQTEEDVTVTFSIAVGRGAQACSSLPGQVSEST